MTIAEVAQVDYTLDVVRLDDLARELEAVRDKRAPDVRHWAAIAYIAAKAEQVDLEPPAIMPCGVCGGVRTCDVSSAYWART